MKNLIKQNWIVASIVLVIVVFFGYQYIYTDSSDSSFIEKSAYSPFNNSLKISIRGTEYEYCHVPSRVWREYKAVRSKGSFYNSAIKGEYDCSNGDELDRIFSHTIPLCLGGVDFSNSGPVKGSDYAISDQKAMECFDALLQEEKNMLSDAGYKRMADGSWEDGENNNPSCEFESELEVYVTRKWQECIHD